jgi:hypothetical protein
VFDVARRFCSQCGGWLAFCAQASCRMPNRMFARWCRRCRAPLAPWESWPCAGGNAAGSGRIARCAPWTDEHGIRLTAPWSGLSLGSEVGPATLVSAYGALIAYTAGGRLVMADIRDGREIDGNAIDDAPVSLHVSGERLAVVSTERIRFFSLLGRTGDDWSAPLPKGFRRLWERQVPGSFRTWVGSPVPYGPHLVVAAAGAGAFGLSCLKLDPCQDLWEDSGSRTFEGELAFLLPWGESGLVVGNRDGQVVGLSGIKGTEAFRMSLPGGLHERFRRAAVDGDAMFWINAAGDLARMELSGRRTCQVLGQAHADHPTTLGVSPGELVMGEVGGTLSRYDAFGLSRRTYTAAARGDEARGEFTLPPALWDDGRMLAATDAATLVFFGPPSDAAPLERAFSFQTGPSLRAYMLVGSIIVGANHTGEVQAFKIHSDGETRAE